MGGIAILLHDISRNFVPTKLFVRKNTLKSILHKVLAKNEHPLNSIMYTCASYKYNDVFRDDQFGDLSEREFRLSIKNRLLFTGIFEQFLKCFLDENPGDEEEYVQLLRDIQLLPLLIYFSNIRNTQISIIINAATDSINNLSIFLIRHL
jgi:hypothetical protein